MATWQVLKAKRRWEKAWGWAKVYLLVLGLFSFPLFIIEEATQVAIWGTWQASKNDMTVLYHGMKTVQAFNHAETLINRCFGWLQPLGYQSYKCWTEATQFWIDATVVKILDHDPTVMDGETTRFIFEPKTISIEPNHVRLENGNVTVLCDELPKARVCTFEGRIAVTEGQITLDARIRSTARPAQVESENESMQ